MGNFRSYFKKSNTLISDNLTNNSQNPVTEISYGTLYKQVSRYIFDVNLNDLIVRINQGFINPNNITKHVLKLTNTIRNASDYKGKKSYSSDIERATSFKLDVFNVNEDWDEGSGYDFIYNDDTYPITQQQASNWYYRKTNVPWTISGGSYQSGVTTIFGNQEFESGDENISIDITDYINGLLSSSGITGVSGYTGTSYGLGIKFSDNLENLETLLRQAVGFHTNHTHTYYEPYIETFINDTINDDRNHFFLDKDNELYLYSTVGGEYQDLTVNKVTIYDNEDNEVSVLSGNSIIEQSKGIYKISLNLNSEFHVDSVIYTDEWDVDINGNNFKFKNEFYLISSDNYYKFNLSSRINPSNYYFNFHGIKEGDRILSGDIRNIKLNIRELYPNQNNFLPLNLEYRLFTSVGSDYQLDVIPFTQVNRTINGYEFNLDTSWLIPQDYKLQIRMKNGSYYEDKETLNFTVISNSIKKY